ncbi:MAG: type II secretion system protein N [Fimbriimonadaceae bacterium]
MKTDNEKKKLIVVGALGVAVLAIGAFQFSGMFGGGEVEATSEESADGKTDEGSLVLTQDELIRQELVAMVSGPLPARDPFEDLSKPVVEEEPEPEVQPTPPPTSNQPTPRRNTSPRPPSVPGNSTPSLTPFRFDPNGGGGFGIEGPGGETSVPEARVPQNNLKGVVVGKRSAAVFQDEQGNQRLVPLGGSLDGDTEVVSIEKDKVIIRENGKTKTLTIEDGSK